MALDPDWSSDGAGSVSGCFLLHINQPYYMLQTMRTTIDIPEDLLEKARRGANLRTKQETVVAGLKELVRKNAYEGLRRLAGKIPEMALDTNLSRGRNKPFRRP
jgi:Arc/MetJ family transcription regulator